MGHDLDAGDGVEEMGRTSALNETSAIRATKTDGRRTRDERRTRQLRAPPRNADVELAAGVHWHGTDCAAATMST